MTSHPPEMTSKRGSRPGPKCKPIGTTKVRHNVMLTREVAESARQLGNGNLSAGIALAVEQAKKSPPSAG